MGLLDNLESQAMNSMGGNSNPLVASVLQMIQSQPGGLQGLVQSFHDKGLGGVVSSWVSSGQNMPISGEQIQEVLGSDRVKQIAAAAGVSPDAANSSLAELLPGIVDKLTPNGQVPEHGNVVEMATSLLQRLTAPKAS